MSKTPTLLLDTNVWLDIFLSERIGHEDSFELLQYAAREGINLAYAACCSKDVYYVVQQALKRKDADQDGNVDPASAAAGNEMAWACLSAMMDNAVAIPIGEPQIWFAHRFKKIHSDYEDDLILGAAETAQVDFLVTSDRTLAKKAPVGAFSPKEMLDYLKV